MGGAAAGTKSLCQPPTQPLGPPQAQALPRHTGGRGLVPGNSAPQRGATVGRQSEARPQPGAARPRIPAQSSLALQPAPYRFSPGWYWGSVDVK